MTRRAEYSQQLYMKGLTILKVGGAVVEDKPSLRRFLDSFAAIEGQKILIHGGGRRATSVASSLGIESRMVEGRRITDRKTLEVVTMVYGGLVNKGIVAELQARRIDAVGLTGADLDIVRSHRRPVTNGIDYGCVGDIDRVGTRQLAGLLSAGAVPVIAPLSHDGRGNILNVNADTMAAAVATALAGEYDTTLIYCFEKPGVLRDANDGNSVIACMRRGDYEKCVADGTISGGMIPKIGNALNAVESGVRRVVITSAEHPDACHGTVIVR